MKDSQPMFSLRNKKTSLRIILESPSYLQLFVVEGLRTTVRVWRVISAGVNFCGLREKNIRK